MTTVYVIWNDSQNGYWTGTEFSYNIDNAYGYASEAAAYSEIENNTSMPTGGYLIFKATIKSA